MKLKALFAVIILIISVFTGCSTANTDTTAPDGMKIFSNEHTPDFTAYVPVSWQIDRSTGTLSAYVSSADSSSVNITSNTLSAPTTLDDYWKSYEEDFKTVFTDMKYEGEAPTTTTLSGEKANKYVYTALLGGNEYKYMQVVCIREMTVYVITYTSTPDGYAKNTEDVNKILSNFTFNK